MEDEKKRRGGGGTWTSSGLSTSGEHRVDSRVADWILGDRFRFSKRLVWQCPGDRAQQYCTAVYNMRSSILGLTGLVLEIAWTRSRDCVDGCQARHDRSTKSDNNRNFSLPPHAHPSPHTCCIFDRHPDAPQALTCLLYSFATRM